MTHNRATLVAGVCMRWEQFKRHIRDLVHGRHNPAEHDWSTDTNIPNSDERTTHSRRATANRAKRKAKREK